MCLCVPAVLKEEFSVQPSDAEVAEGEVAVLNCGPPLGHPEPNVIWKKDGVPISNTDHHYTLSGKLIIAPAEKSHSGSYVCVAWNIMGERQSRAARLSVTEQKDFHRELSALRVTLENVTIIASESNVSLLQSLPAQPHYLDGFEVLYRPLLPVSSDWAALRVSLPGFQAQVGPLKRGYKYEFKVRPYGSSLYGRESNTRHLRVPERAPSAPPLAVSITVNHEQNNTVHLSWEPPPPDSHNGVVQGYQVTSPCLQYHNWTVDSGQHSLDISTLEPGKQYWVTMAAVNGAGVGTLSDPHGFNVCFYSEPQLGGASDPDSHNKDAFPVLAFLQDPVLIGSVGALLWCLLMIAAVSLFRRHNSAGLHRLASEDLIIKHRVLSWKTCKQYSLLQISSSFMRTEFVCVFVLTVFSSSHSTKLTEDLGSIPSISPPSSYHGQAGPNKHSGAPYSHLSASSYSTLMEADQSPSLTAQEGWFTPHSLQISVLPEQRPSLPHSFTSTLGSICGPVGSAESEDGAAAGAQPLPAALCHSGFHSSPSSCYSDWDSSLWNTWSSAMDSNMDSNRTSLISSVDSCYTNDSATFARLLAAAAETMSAASLTGRRGRGGEGLTWQQLVELYTHTH
uniref:Roundabout, axon guidance receptor, homolog 4 (Drosophila) n=1 Tax=Xiphophorus maculatus TaxID=8083 RepID=M3ZVE1_XIPMA